MDWRSKRSTAFQNRCFLTVSAECTLSDLLLDRIHLTVVVPTARILSSVEAVTKVSDSNKSVYGNMSWNVIANTVEYQSCWNAVISHKFKCMHTCGSNVCYAAEWPLVLLTLSVPTLLRACHVSCRKVGCLLLIGTMSADSDEEQNKSKVVACKGNYGHTDL